MRTMGRSKLTPETIATIARHISNGSYQTDAALAAGVHPDTLVHWLQDGADEESGPKRDLYDAVQKARAQASTGMLERIQAPKRGRSRLGVLGEGTNCIKARRSLPPQSIFGARERAEFLLGRKPLSREV